ncbi:GNAT family N-acetyltransferase [Oceanobacillus damuensis]|uniref:GNAT family N-acetyltransferase n=1 Tax=Oceanobacillus damuensis TaxID=937928 RepID=UPI000832735C|nr:GNAT family N-acetyltransferase [Oceanobacillus damuensis]
MIVIRNAVIDDLPPLLDIYNYAILNLTATFELEEQTLEQQMECFDDKYPLIVAEEEGNVIGYSCLNPFNKKAAFAQTAELSIYIAPNHQGKGIGKKLMKAILELAKQMNFHTVIGGITGGNEASIYLHKNFGFVHAGTLKEVGYKFWEWQEVHYYQLIFESS